MNKTEEIKYACVKNVLKYLDEANLIAIWRAVISDDIAQERDISFMENFDDIEGDFNELARSWTSDGNGGVEFAKMILKSQNTFNPDDFFWTYNVSKNILISFNDIMDDEESPFSYDECYKWLVENGVDEIHIYDSTAEDEMVGEFLEAMFPIEDDANEAYDKAAIAVDNLGFTFDDFLLMDWDEIADEVRTEMESVIITIAPIDPFEDFFENHFWESLKNRFEIRNGSGPYKPCIALVKEDGKRSEDPFFDNVYMSVATMYACLIPQIVAKMNRRMSALNSFCRLAGLPVFHCGQGDLCHPTMVLKEADFIRQHRRHLAGLRLQRINSSTSSLMSENTQEFSLRIIRQYATNSAVR